MPTRFLPRVVMALTVTLTVALAVALGSGRAHAQACNIAVADLNFGAIRVAAGPIAETTTKVEVSCTGQAGETIRLCPTLAAVTGGNAKETLLRKIGSPADTIQYALYSDPGRTVPWSQGVDIPLDVNGNGKGSATVYGRLTAVRGVTRVGTYEVVVDLGWVGDYVVGPAVCNGPAGAIARAAVKAAPSKVVSTAKK